MGDQIELRGGSLFSGVGALDRAVNAVLGSTTAWFADHYRPAQRVLEANHPAARVLGDVAAIRWDDLEPIDVLTAGFPCQKLSLLGKREGLRPRGDTAQLFDAPPSGWDLTVSAIRATRPALVVLENVSAILTAPLADGDQPGTAFRAILDDLADLGLDAEWTCVDASAAGAPHRRRRWLCAAADPERFRRGTWRDRHQQGEPVRVRGYDAPGGPHAPDWTAEPVWAEHGPALERWAHAGHGGWAAPGPVVNGAFNPALWGWLMGFPAGWAAGCGLTAAQMKRLAGNSVVAHQIALALPVLLDRLTEPVAA